MSDSLQPHGLHCDRLPCPSLSPGACSNSTHPLSPHSPPALSFYPAEKIVRIKLFSQVRKLRTCNSRSGTDANEFIRNNTLQEVARRVILSK